MEDLKGRSALVTGASTGIGAAVAIAYAARGMRVAVHYNSSRAAAEQVVATIQAAGGEAFALQADVRDSAAIRRVVGEAHDRLGAIDVLVNNAGSLVKRLPIADFDDAVFDEVLHINARSVLAFCREVVPLMRAQGRGGSIVNVSSIASQRALTRTVGYGAAKAAVENFTRWLAVDCARNYGDRLRVNAIAPGFFVGDQNRALLLDDVGGLTPRARTIVEHTPAGRLGEPDDLVTTLLWLCSPASRFVTGVVVPVDGGFNSFGGV